MTMTELDLKGTPQLPYEEHIMFDLDLRNPRDGEILKMLSYLVTTAGGNPLDVKLTRNLTLRNVVAVTMINTSDVDFRTGFTVRVDLRAMCLDIIDVTPVDQGLLSPSPIG